MTDPAAGRALSRLSPVPGVDSLPVGYQRHDPSTESLRAAVLTLAGHTPWSRLTWTELVGRLMSVGRTDIPLARLVEGHVDALRILDQADRVPVEGALYGVWASRSGATGVTARPVDDGFALSGVLRFASGAGVLDRALVPIWTDDHHHLADLAVRDLPVDTGAWQTSAMTVSRTHTVDPAGVGVCAGMIIGSRDFYLERPGFFPGGVGVAAVWAGGLGRLTDLLLDWLDQRTSPAVELRLGALRAHLVTAVSVVDRGGRRLDELLTHAGVLRDAAAGSDLQQVATEVRAVVGAAVRAGLHEVRELAGPAGLAFATDLTRAVADLDLYVRQQNTDADATLLGRTLRS